MVTVFADRTQMDPAPDEPYCLRCGDFYYLRLNSGLTMPCPACSCPRCERLKNEPPGRGGCICQENQQESKEARTDGQP